MLSLSENTWFSWLIRFNYRYLIETKLHFGNQQKIQVSEDMFYIFVVQDMLIVYTAISLPHGSHE